MTGIAISAANGDTLRFRIEADTIAIVTNPRMANIFAVTVRPLRQRSLGA
jgi:hypothetical protein